MIDMLNRRALLSGAVTGTALIAAPALLRAQQLFTTYPFTLGVAAGDPSSDGFVIWTRLAPEPLEPHGGMPPGPVLLDWEVAEDDRFRTVARSGTAVARPELGHSVHVTLAGLKPGRPYWYRFAIGKVRSLRGTARTLLAPGVRLDRLRFAVAGCQNYEDGLYTAFRHLADEEIDFVFHYGDYIYEYASPPVDSAGRPRTLVRHHIGGECYSLDDYRRRYAQEKLDPDLQRAHAAAAWFATPDDHEVHNNWVGLIDQDSDVPPEVFALRRAAAMQAYYEHMPFRDVSFPRGDGMQIYRRARAGDLVDLHLLDTRQFRSDQPCDDGFKPRCAGWADPVAQVLGTPQEAWLRDGLRRGRARWNAVAQQVMVMPLDRRSGEDAAPVRNMDSWGGYDVPRERTLAMMKGLGNVVVLTGDEHQNFAGELRTRGGAGEAVAVEFVGTSISSGGDGRDARDDASRILANNPYLKFSNDQRGYLVCDVTPDVWRTRFRVVERVSTPDAPITTRATAEVAHGTVGLTIG